MKNTINFTSCYNPYLVQFQLAQKNLNLLIKEERLQKRIQRSKRQLLRSHES